MPFTGASFTITTEENSSKRLLVLHKPELGTKIGCQTGESSDAFVSAAAVHSGRQRRPQASAAAVHSGRQRRPQAVFRLSCAIFLGATFYETPEKRMNLFHELYDKKEDLNDVICL